MRLCVSVFQKLRCKGFGFSAASGRDVPFLSFMFGLPQHPVVHAVHSGVNLMAADARKVDLRGAYRSVSHALADKFNRLAVLQHQCRPCVAQYVGGERHGESRLSANLVHGTVDPPQGGFLREFLPATPFSCLV